jgi:hypothetical protein
MERALKFLKAHYQLAAGCVLGLLVAQIQILANFSINDPAISSALIQGCFTLIATFIAVGTGLFAYRAAHVPFEKKQEQLVNLLHADLKSIIGHIDSGIKIRAMVGGDVSDKVSCAIIISRIEFLIDEKSFQKLPANLMEEVIELASEMSYSNAKTEWLKGPISDKVFNSIDLSDHEEIKVDGVFESASRIKAYALSLMKKIENLN